MDYATTASTGPSCRASTSASACATPSHSGSRRRSGSNGSSRSATQQLGATKRRRIDKSASSHVEARYRTATSLKGDSDDESDRDLDPIHHATPLRLTHASPDASSSRMRPARGARLHRQKLVLCSILGAAASISGAAAQVAIAAAAAAAAGAGVEEVYAASVDSASSAQSSSLVGKGSEQEDGSAASAVSAAAAAAVPFLFERGRAGSGTDGGPAPEEGRGRLSTMLGGALKLVTASRQGSHAASAAYGKGSSGTGGAGRQRRVAGSKVGKEELRVLLLAGVCESFGKLR